jgi:hypothetical protein
MKTQKKLTSDTVKITATSQEWAAIVMLAAKAAVGPGTQGWRHEARLAMRVVQRASEVN